MAPHLIIYLVIALFVAGFSCICCAVFYWVACMNSRDRSNHQQLEQRVPSPSNDRNFVEV